MNKLAVQNFVRNYTIETTVPQARRVPRFAGIVREGTPLYIANIPGTTIDETVALASRLGREGMEPVPHIVARRVSSFATLEDLLARLAGEAGVGRVLIVAGDNAKASGELHSSLQIIESGLLEKYRIRTIGVAGHPEGHGQVSEPVLRDALRRKAAYAQKTGASVYIVTQFTFTADPVIAWEGANAVDIGQLPIVVGLPGLATAKTLLKYAMDCGVGPSLQAFSKRYSSLTKLLTISTPDHMIVALARHKESVPQSNLAGIHFFTFGGFQKTADWANKIVGGDFEMTEDGGLKVT
jgi:methylenetetrahydrofolate reductase (NADPH)